ncbi:MAG: urea transporter [Gammaproteobacteria bacterium]|nr:urea transporter [Gammaproteobacteria bacterium]
MDKIIFDYKADVLKKIKQISQWKKQGVGLYQLSADLLPFKRILIAYSTILFCRNEKTGFLFFMATFVFPNAAFSGLLAAIIGSLTSRLFNFPNQSGELHIYNSLLVGLSLGIVYHFDFHLLSLIVLGFILSVLVTVTLSDVFWRLEHLPVLSFPFVIVALGCAFAAQGYGSLSHYLYPLAPYDYFINTEIDAFLTAMGSTFFIPDPRAGLLIFIGVVMTSRYLGLLAVCGYIVGHSLFQWLSGSPHNDLFLWSGFNFILTAMAIGGVFTVPGIRSFVLAMIGASLASLLTASIQSMMIIYGVPVLALPFLLTTLTVLMALKKRQSFSAPYLLLENPELPEVNYENSRLLSARGGAPGSIPLSVPFLDKWQVYQGFCGKYTHQYPWQYALDFIVVDNERSFSNDGKQLGDYYCYGLPVVSPCYGTVYKFDDSHHDNLPGEVDIKNNWGNYLLIQLNSGHFVLLAHLKKGSIKVFSGEHIVPGQVLAQCGNSGRSPQPHIHMHVQADQYLGSRTLPFHLFGVNCSKSDNRSTQFYLSIIPSEKDTVSMILNDSIAQTFHLPIGLSMNFNVTINDQQAIEQQLKVELDLLGQFKLSGKNGSCASFVEETGLQAFFDRNKKEDKLLDIWLLALGLNPTGNEVVNWQDKPAASLFPLSVKDKFLFNVFHPLGGGIESQYRRIKIDRGWLQQGKHTLQISPTKKKTVITEAVLELKTGCVSLLMHADDVRIEAKLIQKHSKADFGIPELVYHYQ